MTEDTTTETAAPMRLRAEAPRVTRLSRKMLAGVGAVALLGIGGAVIYALQTRDMGGSGEELYSTENRPTADGLSGLPRDYTGPVLGPALPGDLGRPILDAQNRGQPVAPPAITTPAVDPEEERRRAEDQRALRQFAAGLGGRDEHDAAIFAAAFAADQTLVFQAVENAHHRAGADVHLATDGGGRHGAVADHGAQTHELRRSDVTDGGKLARMQRNRTRDAAQGPQNAQVVLL